ncbi:DUF4956 domain-containing protein [Croceitalea sp. MTPC5]|uniref:DUF4956 domain-containing protein n=1 Tax=Croceitalea sp. MTPC5 TaxID=3056565 RepID=UPI002B3CB742|nr:DUF4956 domain-containing protein [Croceitalea sp. MTPC5]
MLYVLSILYNKYGRSISNRDQLSKVLILVGTTTFIIISIVKSSLALSLGLVGALSIVRFRTAIKEPEELGYFFIAISIGLGLGASQLLPTLIGFLVLSLIIIFTSKTILSNSFTQNILISLNCKNEEKTDIMNRIHEVITVNSNQVDLKRIKYSEEKINVNYLLNLNSLERLTAINHELLKIDEHMDITFIDNTI